MRLLFVGLLCMMLLTISFFSISNHTVYGEDQIIANSVGLGNSAILELKNNKGSNYEIDSVRIWLSGENSFQSFKTEKGWIGKNTPQGVLIFTTQDSVKPGEVVKFGIKTLSVKPTINWKALDNNGNIIKSAQTITNAKLTDTNDTTDISQPSSVAINDNSTFRLIPGKLSPGSDFRVIGNNFGPNQSLNFYINDKITKTFSSDSDGNFIITDKVPDELAPDRTQFVISDSVGAQTELSIRLTDLQKRTIGQSIDLVFDEIPTTVKRGEIITLKGTATPESTLTITSSLNNSEIISIDSVIVGFDGKWSFENLFTPETDLDTVTITVSDGKTESERQVEVISSKLIRINSEESRYELGDVITFSGSAIANNDLLVYFEDPKGFEIFSSLITVDSSGIVNFEISTDLTQMKGTYILYSTQGGEEGISVVGIGEEPAEVIIVNSEKLNHDTTENVNIIIQGQPNSRVSIIILDDSSKEKISDSIELGPDGYRVYVIESNELPVGSYVVEIRHGKARGDTVFSIGLTQGSGVINMQTTKNEYNPGESILLMGKTGANSLLILTMYDSNENIIKQVEIFSDKNGGFRSDKFRVPNDPNVGTWVIKAKSGGNVTEHTFLVLNILEGVTVTVDRESNTYSLSEIVTISGAGVSGSGEVNIEFLDSEENSVSNMLTIYAKDSGEFSTSWIIPEDVVIGDITIRVTDANTSASTIITVN